MLIVLHCLEHALKNFTHQGTCDNKRDLIWFVPSMHEALSLIKGNRYYRLMVYQLLVSVLHVKGKRLRVSTRSVLLISEEDRSGEQHTRIHTVLTLYISLALLVYLFFYLWGQGV